MARIYGERIMLREYKPDDIGEMRKWVNDASTTYFLSTNFWSPQSLADTESFLHNAMQSSRQSYFFVIADKTDESYIGQIDIFRVNWLLRQGELGMVIASAENRGKGYGCEALKLLQDFAFMTLGLERLELEVFMRNDAALNCYKKAGFTLEGVRRHAYYHMGDFCDIGMMSILRGEYKPHADTRG